MDAQLAAYSPGFQHFIHQVETALFRAAEDARRLAEQTGTKLIIYERVEQGHGNYTIERDALLADVTVSDFRSYVEQNRKGIS